MRLTSWQEEFTKHPAIQALKGTLTHSIAEPIWWTIPGESPKLLNYSEACKTCSFVDRSTSNRQVCQKRFLKALEEARTTRAPCQFVCPIQRYAVALPVLKNGQTAGYLALCHSERAFPKESVALSAATVQTAVREIERDRELKNLSEAIQPRCIALSTIHTIHRLISSTLDLQELLPRIGRLCCQVLRATGCAIWLIDPEKRKLLPKAVVQLEKGKRWVVRPCAIGVGWVGRAASRCQEVTSSRRMVVPLVEEDCVGVILVRRSLKAQPFSALDREILSTLAEQAVIAIRNAQMYEAQERITWGTIQSLSAILDGMEVRSPQGHSRTQLMSEIALGIAQALNVSSREQQALQYAALLHDAGRLGIPERILLKTSRLEPAEFAKVKEHPVKGARLLAPLEVLEPALPVILHHHERYDGTGYPKGLKKEAIPLGARILAVANAFEAMVCERPYRRPLAVSQAIQEIASHAGTQFDPQVVKAFLTLGVHRLKGMVRSHTGRSDEYAGSPA